MPVSRKRLPAVKKGYLVEIRFLDHVCTAGGLVAPIECRAIGEVINEDKQALYIASWLTEEGDFQNWDSHTILKSTIKKVRIIEKRRYSKRARA